MTDPIIDRLDQIKGRADKAADHVGKIAAREHRWTMSIPPRETDTDILLTQCLDTDVPRMEAALRAVLDLHVKVVTDQHIAGPTAVCEPCSEDRMFAVWPCPTYQAISDALGVEAEGGER